MLFLERTPPYPKRMFTTWTSHFFGFNENTTTGTPLEALIVGRVFTSICHFQSPTQTSASQWCHYKLKDIFLVVWYAMQTLASKQDTTVAD